MDKFKTEPSVLTQHYRVHNKTEGKSPRTVGRYNEVLGLFIKWLMEGGSSTAIGGVDENTVRRFTFMSKRSRVSKALCLLTTLRTGCGH